jgi:intracellular septation protein
MKFLFDLFPVILFFAAFKLGALFPGVAESLAHLLNYQADSKQLPILLATAVVIVATLAQIIWVKLRHGKLDNMLIASGIIIIVLGGATLYLHDETFIKWKPTILYWLFASVLSLAELFFNKNLIRSIMVDQITLPEPIWRALNHAWAVFFVMLGVVNLYVAFKFSTDIWVNFKLFGVTGLMLTFVIVQSLLLSKYVENKEP